MEEEGGGVGKEGSGANGCVGGKMREQLQLVPSLSPSFNPPSYTVCIAPSACIAHQHMSITCTTNWRTLVIRNWHTCNHQHKGTK